MTSVFYHVRCRAVKILCLQVSLRRLEHVKITMSTTPKKLAFNCKHFCRICNFNVSGSAHYNLFGQKAKKERIAERLTKVLLSPVENDDGINSPVICIKCFRQFEKLEKAILLTEKELISFRASHSKTCLALQTQRAENQGRVKRCHKPDSPALSAEKPSKQHAATVKSVPRRANKTNRLLFQDPIGNQEILELGETTENPFHGGLEEGLFEKEETVVEVTVQYPSKVIKKNLSGTNAGGIVRNVALGRKRAAANMMISDEEMKATAFKCFEDQIKAECKKLSSNKTVSLFCDRSPENIVNNLNFKQMKEELSTKTPTLYKCLRAAANTDRSYHNKCKTSQAEAEKRRETSFTWAAFTATSLMLRNRNPAVSAMGYKLSLMFWHGGGEKQVSAASDFDTLYLVYLAPNMKTFWIFYTFWIIP